MWNGKDRQQIYEDRDRCTAPPPSLALRPAAPRAGTLGHNHAATTVNKVKDSVARACVCRYVQLCDVLWVLLVDSLYIYLYLYIYIYIRTRTYFPSSCSCVLFFRFVFLQRVSVCLCVCACISALTGSPPYAVPLRGLGGFPKSDVALSSFPRL